MPEAQLTALQARVREDSLLRNQLWATRCLEDAAALAREAGFLVTRADFLTYLRQRLAAGRLRYVPYNDDVLGLSDEALTGLFADQPRILENFMALSLRFKQDPALRQALRDAPDLEASATVSRAAGFDLSKQDWTRYLIAQLRARRLRLVPWD
jgi:predicted ribosomally synthesized peptide with nif11-like leader